MTSKRDSFEETLREYLQGRSNVIVPADLMNASPASRPLRQRPQGRFFALGGRVAAALSLAALVVAVALFANGLIVGPPTPAQSGEPSGPVKTTPQRAGEFPRTILGLPVLTVAEARAVIADQRVAGRAVAIAGWWSAAQLPMSCPAPSVYIPVIQPWCGFETALSDSDAQVDYYTETGEAMSESFMPPDTALRPRVVSETAGRDAPWAGVTDRAMRQLPQRVVVIAHTGDPRAILCAPDAQATCHEQVVLDAFAWVEGRTVGPFVDVGGSAATLTQEQVVSAVERAVPEGTLVTLSAWTDEVYGDLDPRISDGVSRFWFARVIAGGAEEDGAAPLTAAFIDDADGKVALLPLFPDPASQLAVVHLRSGPAFSLDVQLAIEGPGRRNVYQARGQLAMKPAALEPGTYRVAVWTAPEQVLAPAPGAAACEQELALRAGEVVRLSVERTSALTCRITTGG